MKISVSFLLLLFLISGITTIPLLSQDNSVWIDFGGNESTFKSPFPWNNVINPKNGQVFDLINTDGRATGISISVIDPFNSINMSGTTSPNTVLEIVQSASSDSFFGNTQLFGNETQETGGVELQNLDPSKIYTLTIFASRLASDNRETQYVIKGFQSDTLLLQVSNNHSTVVKTTIKPSSDGRIMLTASPGPQNNNLYGFYYLGVLKIEFEGKIEDELILQSPIGGETWQVNKEPNILWKSNILTDVTIDYSINNGSTWEEIAIVQGTQQRYNWVVPNSISKNCLIKLSDSNNEVMSTSVFEITNNNETCRIVILGSSTAAGTGTSHIDSSWVGKYSNTLFQNNTSYEVINLAKGGYTTYHILPAGTLIPSELNIEIDTLRNFTKALSYDPYAIIINMPSNDAARNISAVAQIENFKLISDTANKNSIDTWVCTTQPRNFDEIAKVQIQKDVRDAILLEFGDYAIDFWSSIADLKGHIVEVFDAGDGVHLNDKGHQILFDKVMEKQIDTINCLDKVGTSSLVNNNNNITIFPNPNNGKWFISFDSGSTGIADIRLYDVLGKQLASKVVEIHKGKQTISWNTSIELEQYKFMYCVINMSSLDGVSTKSIPIVIN